MHGNEIIISQVANGWMVKLPSPVAPDDIGTANILVREQMKIMKDVAHGDDVLNEARDKSGIDNVGELINKYIYIFSEFKEVLAFLKLTVDK